jgi:hypothetical protein
MTYDEQYLYELPDFIAGKTPPDVSEKLQTLIRTNPAFAAEYESMKEILTNVNTLSTMAFENAGATAATPLYFNSLSERVMKTVALVPKGSTSRSTSRAWWQIVLSDVQYLFAQTPKVELAGGFLALVITVSLLVFQSPRLDTYTKDTLALRGTTKELPSDQALALVQYVSSSSVTQLVATLSDEDSELLLNELEKDLPSVGNEFKILTDEDLKNLLSPL